MLLVPSLAFANTYSSIDYKIAILPESSTPAIRVEEEIKGSFSDKILINLPFGWAWAYYAQPIKNIKAVGLNGNFTVDKQDTHQLIIDKLEDTNSVKISYEIYQKPEDPSEIYETIIRSNLVHTIEYGLLATPDDAKSEDKIEVSIRWEGVA